MASGAADRRRFTGPETSRPIRFLSKPTPQPLLDVASGLRKDARKPGDMRPIFLQTGLVPQANGSAYIETGNTKIICSVYGPHPTRRDAPYSSKARLNVEVKLTPFAHPGRRKNPGKDTESGNLAALVSQALLPSLRLDLLPKSAIDLYIVVIEGDGPLSDISPGITAASIALAEAGIEMYGLVCSCSAAIAAHADQAEALIDTTYQESISSPSLLSLSCLPAMGTITNLSFQGDISRSLLKSTTQTLQRQCIEIHKIAAAALREGQEEKQRQQTKIS